MADDVSEIAKNLNRSFMDVHQRIDRLMRPPDPAHFEKIIANIVPPAQAQAESFQEYIKSHIESLQKNLKPGEELLLYVFTGADLIRVLDVTLPDWEIVVLSGLDTDGNPTQLITNINQVQFVCKVVKASPEQEPKPIGFRMPVQR